MPPESSLTIVSARWLRLASASAASTAVARARRAGTLYRRANTREDLPAGQLDVEVVELRHRRPSPGAPAWTAAAARSPSTVISPASASACAVSIRIVVDLPAPFGPSRPKHTPAGTSRSRPSTADDRAEALAPRRGARSRARQSCPRLNDPIARHRRDTVCGSMRLDRTCVVDSWPRVDRGPAISDAASIPAEPAIGARCRNAARGAPTPSQTSHATQDPPDRRPWRRRLLDGEGRIAARRVRAVARSTAPRPRVCFLPTASGDADHYVVRFYRRFSPSCEASHLSLFRRDQGTGGVEDDFATHLLGAGSDLRRRRQRREHARRLARARAR